MFVECHLYPSMIEVAGAPEFSMRHARGCIRILFDIVRAIALRDTTANIVEREEWRRAGRDAILPAHSLGNDFISRRRCLLLAGHTATQMSA